ncbi:MAG: ABC transporter ATP-binding protein [Planctomycetota bacterium]|jgi:oligopeptide/dipeptide ABC transporter ATP-binding protein|nr:ABC transporter ATP-binding protein [Planctomycetota bacterium]
MNGDSLLEVIDLRTVFVSGGRLFSAVDGVSFAIRKGETLALVGESGSGKSVTSLSIMRLVPNPPGRIAGGGIFFRSRSGAVEDLARLPLRSMRRVRGGEIAMIFQEPMTSLNPLFRVGFQISEAIRLHRGLGRREALREAERLLGLVDIPDPGERLWDFPHQLSGGMRQRVMIAMALSCQPSLVIADEPTTALDVTIQAQILDLMRSLQRELGMSILFITHNLGVVAEMADRVAVMYAGRIVETGTTRDVFSAPRHPYTRGLMDCIPGLIREGTASRRLYSIPGGMPDASRLPDGCVFAPRCRLAEPGCAGAEPELAGIGGDRFSRCRRWKEV